MNNEIVVVKNQENGFQNISIYLNGMLLEDVKSIDYNIDSNSLMTVKFEVIINSLTQAKEPPEDNCVVLKGKKYRLVPYEEWMEPIIDSIQF